jgi:hypothetical protein
MKRKVSNNTKGGEIMKTQQDFPIVMKAQDVADAMGISKRLAYDVMEMEDFPAIRMRKIKLVARESFFEWLHRAGKVVK